MADVSSITSNSAAILSLVTQYRDSLRNTSVTPLETKKSNLNTRLGALTLLKSKLDSLYSSATSLSKTGETSQFLAYAAVSSNTSVATASASSSQASGTHTLKVNRLAGTDTLLSKEFTSAGTDFAEGAQTLTINGVEVSVTVSSSANATALADIASAINNNPTDTGMTASVVYQTSDKARLVLTGKNTGQANGITFGGEALATTLGYAAMTGRGQYVSANAGAGYIQADAALLDASFDLDSMTLTRGTNVITDALSGVTLMLKSAQASADPAVALTVGTDKDGIRAKVQEFITNYNSALSYIRDRTAVDATNHTRQVLASESIVLSLRYDLRTNLSRQVSSVKSGNPSVLSEIGITTASNGTLTLSDSAAFDAALALNVSKVSDLFNTSDGIATRMKTLLDDFVKSGGQFDSAKASVNAQMTNLTTRISTLDDLITKKADRYGDEFVRIQNLITVAANQQKYINSLFGTTYTY
jgi:flagellar hook-associated protein 2